MGIGSVFGGLLLHDFWKWFWRKPDFSFFDPDAKRRYDVQKHARTIDLLERGLVVMRTHKHANTPPMKKEIERMEKMLADEKTAYENAKFAYLAEEERRAQMEAVLNPPLPTATPDNYRQPGQPVGDKIEWDDN